MCCWPNKSFCIWLFKKMRYVLFFPEWPNKNSVSSVWLDIRKLRKKKKPDWSETCRQIFVAHDTMVFKNNVSRNKFWNITWLEFLLSHSSSSQKWRQLVLAAGSFQLLRGFGLIVPCLGTPKSLRASEYVFLWFFAHSVDIKLASSQAAQLSLHFFLGKLKNK